MYFTQRVLLLSPLHSIRMYGSPEASTSATIFTKYGVKTSSGGQVIDILKRHLETWLANKLWPNIISCNAVGSILSCVVIMVVLVYSSLILSLGNVWSQPPCQPFFISLTTFVYSLPSISPSTILIMSILFLLCAICLFVL